MFIPSMRCWVHPEVEGELLSEEYKPDDVAEPLQVKCIRWLLFSEDVWSVVNLCAIRRIDSNVLAGDVSSCAISRLGCAFGQ